MSFTRVPERPPYRRLSSFVREWWGQIEPLEPSWREIGSWFLRYGIVWLGGVVVGASVFS